MNHSSKKMWQQRHPAEDTRDRLVRSLGCHPVIARLLNNRSIFSLDDAQRFLNPSLKQLRPPHLMRDIERATGRIIQALQKRENILIFGDYDVDGITSTWLLHRFLRSAGASVSYYIPHRVKEGYGLKPEHIFPYAVSRKTALVITVDCGSSSHAAVAEATRHGIDIIITDHHEPPVDLPAALAVVNPKRKDCSAGLEFLAGVGVIFYLLIQLRMRLRENGHWHGRPEPNLKQACDLVALGTIADMVPLRDENRVLARAGLDELHRGGNRGVQVLMEQCGVDRRNVGAREIAFKLAPRLNAAGRVDHAEAAMALLSAQAPAEAFPLAENLDRLNNRRQALEKAVLDEIDAYLTDHPADAAANVIVLSAPEWHLGILGIVASRIVNRYARPAVVLTLDGGTAKGSARSVPGIDLALLFDACSDHLIAYGGHAMAAGLQLHAQDVTAFKHALNQTLQERIGIETLPNVLQTDGPLDFSEISGVFVEELEMLKPFGEQNPPPLFVAGNVRVLSSKMLAGGHRRMSLRQAKGPVFQAIQFNVPPQSAEMERFEAIAYRPQVNRWNGREEIQLLIKDIKMDR